MGDDLRKTVRAALLEHDLTLAAVVRRTPGLDYSRIERVLLGQAKPYRGEVGALLAAIDRVAGL